MYSLVIDGVAVLQCPEALLIPATLFLLTFLGKDPLHTRWADTSDSHHQRQRGHSGLHHEGAAGTARRYDTQQGRLWTKGLAWSKMDWFVISESV